MMHVRPRLTKCLLLRLWSGSVAGAALLVAVAACSSGPAVVPREMKPEIDNSVSFPELLQSPSSYKGRTLVLAGEILSAKRLKDGTQLEILQLPIADDEDPPTWRRTESQGRFLAFDRGARDPASYQPGSKVTLVAEVTGETLGRLDDSDYRYPTVDIKHLYVWDANASQRRGRGPVVGLFGGMGFGFGGGRSGSFGGLGIGTGY
ncbi:MAG TPA: Slp family lipoprotein [Nitrospira sp.]|nr:Slp family lipoprotein [Nitrospira sp.]